MTRNQKLKARAKAIAHAAEILEDVDKGLRIPHEALALWALYNEQINIWNKELNNDQANEQ